jgi:hypothetical protein
MANPEVYRGSGEHTAEVEKAAAERAAELREQAVENGERPEAKAEHLAQEARAEAEKQARPAEDYRPAAEKETAGPSTITAKRSPEKAYRQTMQQIQGEMSAPARTFSKVIHNKAVEKVSDVAGTTIARPNALLSGAICAFVLVFALYLHARYFGYALQGSETIVAFIVGYALGITIDLIRTMIRGKR